MLKFSRLSDYKVSRIILCFCEDITAISASKILKINRNTINLYYNYFRELILRQSFEENARDYGIFSLMRVILEQKESEGKEEEEQQGKRLYLVF